MSDAPPTLRSALLAATPHAFLGRQGGISTGLYASLNVGLGSADDPASVAENRRRAAAAVLPAGRLVTLHQVHSAIVHKVADPWDDDHRPQGDGLVTDRPGIVLGILTADCAPILFADAQAGVIGAAHAGWKGALGGVIEATVAAMEALGAARSHIGAAIGPCIAQASYEVDDAFRQRFCDVENGYADFFINGLRDGRHQFDLEGFCKVRLEASGIAAIAGLGTDTYADAVRWFSFRRTTHAGESDYGRQLSAVALPA